MLKLCALLGASLISATAVAEELVLSSEDMDRITAGTAIAQASGLANAVGDLAAVTSVNLSSVISADKTATGASVGAQALAFGVGGHTSTTTATSTDLKINAPLVYSITAAPTIPASTTGGISLSGSERLTVSVGFYTW